MPFLKAQRMKVIQDIYLAKANTFAFSIFQLKRKTMQNSIAGFERLKRIKNLVGLPCELS